MSDAEMSAVLNAVVDAFMERNSDLWQQAKVDCYLYGAVTHETSMAIADRMEAEANEPAHTN